MCLAVPAKITERKDWLAVVDMEGVAREVSLMLLIGIPITEVNIWLR